MKKAKAIRTKILLTTIHQPLGVDNETCTKNIQAEMYHAQVTLAQGPFSIRTVCTGWGLEFIAVNLNTPTTVLHYPTKKQLIKELAQDYGYVGIGFSICTFPKAVELCSLVRTVAPKSKIVLGGYGTVLPECDQYADYVCREEGVNFFKRLLCEKKNNVLQDSGDQTDDKGSFGLDRSRDHSANGIGMLTRVRLLLH